jgi:hypothetical protein
MTATLWPEGVSGATPEFLPLAIETKKPCDSHRKVFLLLPDSVSGFFARKKWSARTI